MAKQVVEDETKIITQSGAPEVSKWLIERLSAEEKDSVLTIFLNKEIRQKLTELDKKGKQVEATIQEYGLSVEKRVLNRIIMEEAKQQILARRTGK